MICPTCNYPEWWVDNDCSDCSMSFDQALAEVQNG